jgi:predicted O-methyltransferase YrrM
MKSITLPGIDEYVCEHTSRHPQYLSDIEEKTQRDFEAPQMILGIQGARLLQALIYALRPNLVLEIGTFTGYSALSMAAALPANARIITCELNERHARAAKANIAASPHANRISIELGPALETIHRLPGPFDFVFMDADKTQYMDCFEAVLPKLGARGMIAADNTLWNGDVLNRTAADQDTQALRKFNNAVTRDSRVTSVLLTVRDGMTLIWPASYR